MESVINPYATPSHTRTARDPKTAAQDGGKEGKKKKNKTLRFMTSSR